MQQRLWHAFLMILRKPDSWAGRFALAVGTLALFVSVPARAVFYTVCPTGCSTTTITSALSLASATDTVVLESNITESVTLNSSIAGIQSSSSRAFTWVGNISQAALTLGTGLSQSVTFTGLVLDESGGMAPTVAVNSLGPGVSVTFINCQIQSSPAVNSGPLINAAGLSGGGPDSLVLDSCDLIGNAVLSAGLSANLSVPAGLRVQNCVFQGFNAPNASCIALNTASTNAVARFWNNTFYGYGGYAVVLNTRGDLRNNLFAGGPTLPSGDVAWQGSANPADAVTNAFADVTNTAGYGSGNLFGISASAECVSPASGDFHLLQGASCVDSGSNLASLGVLVDKQGTPRPQGCCYDIGAFEFVPPPTATPTAIPTATDTAVPTATNTAVPTATPSPAFTPAPTATPLPCVWVLTGSAVLPAGTYNLCSVTVQSGATLTIQGSVTLNLSGDFDVQNGGTVNGTGLGYPGGSNGQNGAGPGGGSGSVLTLYGGGGGGYGGAGGNDGISGSGGGATYGSLTAPADMGSGGGAGQSGAVPVAGGAGGAALIVNAPSGTVLVDGSIVMDGAPGGAGSGSNSGGGGGGAGGSVYLQALTLAGSGAISASGAQGGGAGTTGNTGVSGGGSGGGGRVDLCASGTDIYAGVLHINGITGGVATSGTGNSSGGLSYGGTLEYCASSTGPSTSTPTRTVTRTHTPVPTQTITPTDSPVVTPSDTLTPTPTDSPVVTPSDTLTPTPTDSPVVTPSDTLTSTPTDSPVVTPSDTLTSTPTDSPVVTPSDTLTSTPTDSPVVTPSDTLSSTPTHSPVVTPLSTRTPSPSATPQIQPSPTATPPAPVVSPTDSPSPGPTSTPVPQAVLSTNLFRPQGQGPLAISALVPRDGHVTVRIYDLTGERVAVAADENLAAGSWLQATWDGRNDQGEAVASGIYFVSVRGGGLQNLLKVVVLR